MCVGLCDPACPWQERSCLFNAFVDWQTTGHSCWSDKGTWTNVPSWTPSCTFAMLDNVEKWHLLRHHALKDSVFEGGMNTNHKMGEEQVACVCLCVLHSWVLLAWLIEGQVTLPAGQIWAAPAPAAVQRAVLVLVRVPACKHAHWPWAQMSLSSAFCNYIWIRVIIMSQTLCILHIEVEWNLFHVC